MDGFCKVGDSEALDTLSRRGRECSDYRPAWTDIGLVTNSLYARTNAPRSSPNGLYPVSALPEFGGLAYTPSCSTMNGRRQFGYSKRRRPPFGLTGLICCLCLWPTACQSPHQERIAVIPQVDGDALWEPAHVGAEDAADRVGVSVYWNAPTNADDVQAHRAAEQEHLLAGRTESINSLFMPWVAYPCDLTRQDVTVEDGQVVEVSPPGFSGVVSQMKRRGIAPERAFALAWTMYRKGQRPHVKPEANPQGVKHYISPEEYDTRRGGST